MVGIISGCNLTSPSPPSRLPQVDREKPRLQKPTPKPGTKEPIASATNNANLLLGNPSNAASNIASIDNYLMVKPQYVLSYNSKTKTANWVSWQLNRSWIGAADRQDNFRPDDALPAAAYKVRPNDYTGSGYDRGHIAPSADRTRNEADNSSTFLMTNFRKRRKSTEVCGEIWRNIADRSCNREKSFISLQGQWGVRQASVKRRKSLYQRRLGKLS